VRNKTLVRSPRIGAAIFGGEILLRFDEDLPACFFSEEYRSAYICLEFLIFIAYDYAAGLMIISFAGK
jgi:hypothetical protein